MPLALWYAANPADIADFEKQMRRKVHYVVKPNHLWANIANLARTQSPDLLDTLRDGFKYIENESFQSTFQGLFSEINLGSDKLGRTHAAATASGASSLMPKTPRSPRGIMHRIGKGKEHGRNFVLAKGLTSDGSVVFSTQQTRQASALLDMLNSDGFLFSRRV